MHHRPALLAFAFAAALSGCLAADPPDSNDAAEPLVAQAPEWRPGDWWTYEWSSEIYGYTFQATVVVGSTTDEGYHIGMPVNDYSLDALLFHLPAVGPVGPSLEYGVHEIAFTPLAFPLSDGAQWHATYISAPVHLSAHEVVLASRLENFSGFMVSNQGSEQESGRHYELGYAPDVAWFTYFERVELDGTVRERIELVEYGHDYQGAIRLLGDIKVPYLQARTQVALEGPAAPALPVDTFDPDDSHNRVFAACVFGDAAGVYDISIENAAGEVCRNTGSLTPDNVTRRIEMVEVDNVAGEWTVRFGAVGSGLAIAEVLAYESWDVTLGMA